MKENRRKRSISEKLFFLFAFIIIAGGFVAISSYLGKEVVVKAVNVPIVYAVYGDEKPCFEATDAQGKEMTCAEAMKGSYHTEWVASKTLNEN